MIELPSPLQSPPYWAERLSPRLNSLWRGRWRAGTVEPARYLYDHELVLVTEGSCLVQIEEQRHEVQAGHYIIIPPNTYHVTKAIRRVYRNCVHFDWQRRENEEPRPIFCYYPERPKKSALPRSSHLIPPRHFSGSFPSIHPIPPLIETLFHRWQAADKLSQALAHATFLEILILLIPPSGARVRPPAQAFEQAYAVKDLLERPSAPTEGIQEMMASLGFSYPHLCRQFRGAFGVTPVEYRNAIRLERAKALLSDSRLTIAEIAYSVGFQDAGYFTRQFRRQNGVSPKQLRNQALHQSRP